MGNSRTNGRIRTGLFEIDLHSGELYKSGRRVPLQVQPFRVLAMLLEQPGQVVARQELQTRVWPSDTYVAFDEGLNTAIRKLRAALGDSATNPRFVETISRRGYRFIAPVSYEETAEATALVSNLVAEVFVTPESGPATAELAPSASIEFGPEEKRAHHGWQWFAATLVSAALLFLAWLARPSLPPLRVLQVRQLTRLGNVKRPIFTDGPRIYFMTGSGGFHDQLHTVSVEGGESVFLQEENNEEEIRSLSPNGSELLVKKGSGFDGPFSFWKVSLPSRSRLRLGAVVGKEAAWSPDGETIAFTDEMGLNLVKDDGSGANQLVSFHGESSALVWSPDGRRIRWTAISWLPSAVLSRTLEETDVGTGATRPVPLGRNAQRAVGWVGNGRYFIFTSSESGIANIWAVREARSWLRKTDYQPVKLTAGPLTFIQPIVGKDGKTLFATGSQPRAELVRYDQRSRGFEPFLGGLQGDQVSFSPDGQWLAYIAYPERTLWRCRINGKDRLQLTSGTMEAAAPQWSPDGTQIAFNSAKEGEMTRGYLMAAGGGPPQPLLAASGTGQEHLSWSPDGRRVMYAEVSPSPSSRIRILDLNSHEITDVPGSMGLFGAAWSPNGRYIAARNAAENLELFDFQTGRWATIAPVSIYLTWSPDSQYIYFNTMGHWPRTRESDPGFFRLRIRDGKKEKIFGLPDFAITGIWAVAVSVAPDGSPIVMKNAGTSDLYALDLDLP